MNKPSYILRSVLLIALITMSSSVFALSHYLTASLGGGATIPMALPDGMERQLGGEGQLSVAYELGHQGFFFNVGVGAEYMLLRGTVERFADQFARQDKNGIDINYRYVYGNYEENDRLIHLTIPVQVGYRFLKYGYVAAGVKFSLPLWGQNTCNTKMYTELEYTNLIAPISRDVPSYGAYKETDYSSTDASKQQSFISTCNVAPNIEIGGWLPISRKVNCRIGAFCEYVIPLKSGNIPESRVDYSAVDVNPQTQNQTNLSENIHFCSQLTTHTIVVGLRCTFRFKVAGTSKICNCVKDDMIFQ